jgi:hypothetical protein
MARDDETRTRENGDIAEKITKIKQQEGPDLIARLWKFKSRADTPQA